MFSRPLKIVVGLFLLSGVVGTASPTPLMIEPGDLVVGSDFDGKRATDGTLLKLRKETVIEIEGGVLRALPPVLTPKVAGAETKWGKSTFARVGLVGLPMDYVGTARWKFIKPADAKTLAKGVVYIDLGHRMIRVTINREGATLLLENHLVGRHDGTPAVVLDEAPSLKLVPDHWYEIVVEVKGNEVVIQVDDHVLYGKHDLIAGERYDTFNFDATGDGFLLDRIEAHTAGNFRPDWPAKRKALSRR